MLIIDPPATAGGTDRIQVCRWIWGRAGSARE